MRYKLSRLAIACAFGLLPASAFADLTARDVWTDLQTHVTSMGQVVTAEREQAGDGTLVLTNVTSRYDLMPTGSAETIVPSIELTETPDGAVTITLAPVITTKSSVTSPDGPISDIASQITHEGLSLIASGEVGHISYHASATRLSIETQQTMQPGDDTTLSSRVTLNDMDGQYETVADGPATNMLYDMTAALLELSTSGGSKGSTFELNGQTAELTISGGGRMPGVPEGSTLTAMIAAGFDFSGGYTMGASRYSFNFAEGDKGIGGEATSESGKVDVAFTPDGVRYDGSGKGIALTFAGPSLPLPPVSLAMAESTFGVTMPVAASEEPQDFGLRLRLAGLTVDDALWRLFDPQAVIPRDPATIALALSGKGNWLFDIFDPEAAAAVDAYGDTPGELHALDINDLQVKLGGADLTGEGAFTFDNDDTTTWNGLPAPDGSLNLQLTGGYGLLDKLVELGLIPQDKALGARMMLGAFTKPGDSPDSMTTQIVVQPDGGVLANGTKIK